MTGTPLSEILAALEAGLPGVTLLKGDVSLEHPTVRLTGGIPAFQKAMGSAGTSLAFTQQLLLVEDDFTVEPEAEEHVRSTDTLIERPVMQPFRDLLGQPWLLRAFFLHAGYQIESVWTAPWWDAFTAALQAAQAEHDQALEAQAGVARAERKETSARMIGALRARLPSDEAFIALACEARPRITAMRLRAVDILKEELGIESITASEDPALRELAARARELHRKRRLP